MALTTNESVGASGRLNVLRLGASRLGGHVTTDALDKDLDGTYAWKRLDSGVRYGAPALSELESGNWTITRGDDL
jgi:hypothetical protein